MRFCTRLKTRFQQVQSLLRGCLGSVRMTPHICINLCRDLYDLFFFINMNTQAYSYYKIVIQKTSTKSSQFHIVIRNMRSLKYFPETKNDMETIGLPIQRKPSFEDAILASLVTFTWVFRQCKNDTTYLYQFVQGFIRSLFFHQYEYIGIQLLQNRHSENKHKIFVVSHCHPEYAFIEIFSRNQKRHGDNRATNTTKTIVQFSNS